MVSLGDEMDYNLVRPDYGNEQTYKMSMMQGYRNSSAHRNNMENAKCTSPKLFQTVPLKNGSIYVNTATAHDDEMYFHHLNFAPEEIPRNRVRVVLVFRWLAVPTFFSRVQTIRDVNNMARWTNMHLSVSKALVQRTCGGMHWDMSMPMGIT